MNALKTKLLAAMFVPALALSAGVASAGGDTNKVTGQSATNGSTNTNDKGSSTAGSTAGMTGMGSSKSSTGATGMNSSKSSAAGDTFARLDVNHDGKLSAGEAATDSKVKGMWKKFDANNDGTVSQAEFAAHEADLK
ncbi:MAG TPA: EF-hand domain-containing protein [Vicinamibacterales bacterium]|nr:EF-hand domain-containing protein [Vicinamibacterales bacterium]